MISSKNGEATEKDEAVAVQKKIQHETLASESVHPKSNESKASKAVQAGPHDEPQPPFPEQQLTKPGLESQLDPSPQFEAVQYKGSEKLLDMVALVTGGDSGIGRAVSVLYAREGADIAVVYLDEDEDAEETKQQIEKEGRRCILIPGDVKSADFCNQAVQQAVQAFGKLDILVNNASFQEHADTLEDITEEHFDQTFRTNMYGYFHMAKAALPHLRRGSSIINTGSETGLFGSKKLLDYSATKGAIHAFTKSLASNLITRGIRVNAVAPGPVWTPLNPADKAAEDVSHFGEANDMKRPAQPEELSPAYVFLASPACSSYITGIVLPVLGGVTGGA